MQDLRMANKYREINTELAHKTQIIGQLRQEINSYNKKNIKLEKIKLALNRKGIKPETIFRHLQREYTRLGPRSKPQIVPALQIAGGRARSDQSSLDSDWSELSVCSKSSGFSV